MISSHSHVGSQALGEVRHRIVDVIFFSSSLQMVCKATFKISVVLGFGWSLWCFSGIASQMR